MTELEQFMTKALDIGLEMRRIGAKYGWKTPVTLESALKKSTCVTYANVVLQEAGYLPKGLYVHYSNGKLAGNGLSYIKKHPEKFEILHVKASPQKLGDALKRGDVCFYAVPHMQIFSKRNANGSPMWYSLERGPGGIGAKAKLTLSGVFSFYTRRKIEYIIRIKFGDEQQAKPLPAIYKAKMNMNMRKEANTSSAVLCTIPKGASVTVIRSLSGSAWKQVRYCDVTGYMNCASQYATKIQ